MKTTFTACEHLDFGTQFINCEKQLLSSGKVFWMRDVPSDLPRMVQFCSLRGRLNHPMSCLCSKDACCSDYREKEHVVEVES